MRQISNEFLIKNLVDHLITLCKNRHMIIGTRLKKLREERNLSQGDIEKRTGLLRCYISRVENGHTVPSLETLERLGAALELPLYQLFYEGDEPPALPNLSKRQTTEELVLDADQEKELRFYEKVKRLLTRIDEKDRQLLLYMAQKLASR
jgi:transcriptional regulator with XRE-family HTH domain